MGRRHLIGLSVVFCISISHILAMPLSLYTSIEGSTDEEEPGNITQVFQLSNSSFENQTTASSPVQRKNDFLSRAVSFLEENMFLILVWCSLAILTFLIVCGAIVMSHSRKATHAYYPSSFPSKMYVDQKDKAGGTKLFSEVPERAAPEQQAEPLDSHKELQAAIMRAAKNLRTPSKPAAETTSGSTAAVGGHRAAADGQPEGVPEGNQPAEESEGEAEPAAGGPEIKSSSPLTLPLSQGDEPQRSEPVPSLRPSSLHIHNDSATLQLIAGETTAF